jgi:hypothetical protein
MIVWAGGKLGMFSLEADHGNIVALVVSWCAVRKSTASLLAAVAQLAVLAHHGGAAVGGKVGAGFVRHGNKGKRSCGKMI